MTLWMLLGCAGSLIPGERVLGDEVSAVVVDGSAGSGFGGAVSVGEDAAGELTILVGASDAGRVVALDSQGAERWSVDGVEGLGTRVGWVESEPWAWAPGVGLFWLKDGLEEGEVLPAATAIAICPDGEVLAREGKGEATACEEVGAVHTSCEGAACVVERPGSEIDQAETSAGSAVGFWGSQFCYGDARIGSEEERGEVRCEDGTSVSGEPGDHLGLAIGGGRVAGIFNRHLRPPRARIVALDGGDTWVVDRAAERSRIALHAAHGLMVVGVPGFGATHAREGRLYMVEEEE